MAKWHYERDGQPNGPVSDEQLQALAQARVVHGGTRVWRSDFADWRPLAETDYAFKDALSPPPVSSATPSSGAAARYNSEPDPSIVKLDEASPFRFFTLNLSQRYVQFEGRARRKEYWSYTLFWVLTATALFLAGLIVDALVGNFNDGAERGPIAAIILVGLFYLATFLPSLAVMIRRLHDVGLTGWLVLIALFPYLGSLALLVMMLLPTEATVNKHGAPPKLITR